MANESKRSNDTGRDDEAGPVSPAPVQADDVVSNDPTLDNPAAREVPTRGSASGISAADPESEEERKALYKKGATLVSRID